MKVLLLVLSALFSALSFYKFPFLIFFSLVPFLYIVSNYRYGLRFLMGFIWGILFFLPLVWWIKNVSIVGLLFLCIYLGIYPALFAILIPSRFSNPVYIAAVWAETEILRRYLFTGLPWGCLGYVLHNNINLIQIANVFGTEAISFLVIFTNAVISGFILRKKNSLRYGLVCFLFFLTFLIYGRYRIAFLECDFLLPNIAVAQTNVDSFTKWSEEMYPQELKNFRYLYSIAREKGAQFVIFPETIFPFLWNKDRRMMEDVRRTVLRGKLPVILGVPYSRGKYYYNASVMINFRGAVENVYFKTHLVPFGEYIPLSHFLSWVGKIYPIANYAPGEEINIFELGESRFGVLICYEILFPRLVIKAVKKGADFLINQSDEGWFGKSPEIFLANAIVKLRAIEAGRSIIRATNTGVSCVITPDGKVRKELLPFKAGVLVGDVPVFKKISFYTRCGYILFPSFLIVFILAFPVIISRRFKI